MSFGVIIRLILAIFWLDCSLFNNWPTTALELRTLRYHSPAPNGPYRNTPRTCERTITQHIRCFAPALASWGPGRANCVICLTHNARRDATRRLSLNWIIGSVGDSLESPRIQITPPTPRDDSDPSADC